MNARGLQLAQRGTLDRTDRPAAPLPLAQIPPYFGNGAIIFEPVAGSDAAALENMTAQESAAGSILRASRADTPASLIYRAQCPYIFSDATITGEYSSAEPGAITLALSFDQGQTWTEVWRSPDRSGTFAVNPRTQISSRYAYWLRVGLAGGKDPAVTGLHVRSTFVASPLALPGKLSLGANRVCFFGTPSAPIKTSCTWVERRQSALGVGLNTISYYLNSGEALRNLIVVAPDETAPLQVALSGRVGDGDISVEGLPAGWLDGPRRHEVKATGDKQATASFGLRPEGAVEGEVRGFEVVVREGGRERRVPAQVLVASAPLVREAEQADATSDAVGATALPEASGGRVAAFSGDGQLTYNFASAEGRYALWIRARWDGSNGAGLTYTLDDATPRNVRSEAMIGFTDDWSDPERAYTKMFAAFGEGYRHWSWYRIPGVALKTGDHRLTLGARAGAQLDALMLLPETDSDGPRRNEPVHELELRAMGGSDVGADDAPWVWIGLKSPTMPTPGPRWHVPLAGRAWTLLPTTMPWLSMSRAREAGLTSRRQPERCDPRLWKEPPVNAPREGFRGAVRSLPLISAVDHRRHGATDSGVSAPVVVVLGEVIEELAQVIQPSDDRHSLQPFLLEGQNDTFSDRDGAVPTHRTKALLDVPVPHQSRKHLTREDAFLVTDEMLGRAMPKEGLLQKPPPPSRHWAPPAGTPRSPSGSSGPPPPRPRWARCAIATPASDLRTRRDSDSGR